MFKVFWRHTTKILKLSSTVYRSWLPPYKSLLFSTGVTQWRRFLILLSSYDEKLSCPSNFGCFTLHIYPRGCASWNINDHPCFASSVLHATLCWAKRHGWWVWMYLNTTIASWTTTVSCTDTWISLDWHEWMFIVFLASLIFLLVSYRC